MLFKLQDLHCPPSAICLCEYCSRSASFEVMGNVASSNTESTPLRDEEPHSGDLLEPPVTAVTAACKHQGDHIANNGVVG